MKSGASPSEWFLSVSLQKYVGHEASVPSVAIYERVNQHKLVMKSNSNFINSERFVFQPKLGVFKQLLQLGVDLQLVHANVFVALSCLASPFPNPIEHFFVKIKAESCIKKVGLFFAAQFAAPKMLSRSREFRSPWVVI